MRFRGGELEEHIMGPSQAAETTEVSLLSISHIDLIFMFPRSR